MSLEKPEAAPYKIKHGLRWVGLKAFLKLESTKLRIPHKTQEHMDA
jgi:hypothetical protein